MKKKTRVRCFSGNCNADQNSLRLMAVAMPSQNAIAMRAQKSQCNATICPVGMPRLSWRGKFWLPRLDIDASVALLLHPGNLPDSVDFCRSPSAHRQALSASTASHWHVSDTRLWLAAFVTAWTNLSFAAGHRHLRGALVASRQSSWPLGIPQITTCPLAGPLGFCGFLLACQ